MNEMNLAPFERVLLKRKGVDHAKWFCGEFSNFDGGYITLVGGLSFPLNDFYVVLYKDNEWMLGTNHKLQEEEENKPVFIVAANDAEYLTEGFGSLCKLNKVLDNEVEAVDAHGNIMKWSFFILMSDYARINLVDVEKRRLCVKTVENGKIVSAFREKEEEEKDVKVSGSEE